MATDTRPGTAEVWAWLAEVPDPEIPVISVTDLGIIRDVAWDDDTLVVTVTPTYSGCPATASSTSRSRRRCASAASTKLRLKRQLSPAWTTAWISAEGREKLRAYGIAPPVDGTAADGRLSAASTAGRQPRDRLPALRLDRRPSGSASSARPPARPATAAPTASNPSTTSRASERTRRPAMARFHSLDVADVRRETRDAVVVTLRPRDEDRGALRLHPGPVPDLPPRLRRRGAAPLLLDLRRPGRRPRSRSASSASTAAPSRPGPTRS